MPWIYECVADDGDTWYTREREQAFRAVVDHQEGNLPLLYVTAFFVRAPMNTDVLLRILNHGPWFAEHGVWDWDLDNHKWVRRVGFATDPKEPPGLY